jgi:hypothetical protein
LEKHVVMKFDLSEQSPMADCTVKVGGVSIPTHKWILGQHSEMFKAMFESEMTEGATSTVTISAFPEEIVRSLLRCVYSPSAIDIELESHAVELFAITNMYAFDILHRQCARYLILHTCAQNASDMLRLAHLYEHAILKQTALKALAMGATSERRVVSMVVDLGAALMVEFIGYLARRVRVVEGVEDEEGNAVGGVEEVEEVMDEVEEENDGDNMMM